jgi:hypothetical protein
MESMSRKRVALIFCLGCLAAAGCRGASKQEPALDGRVLARAAEHFHEDPDGIAGRLLCQAPGRGGSVLIRTKCESSLNRNG